MIIANSGVSPEREREKEREIPLLTSTSPFTGTTYNGAVNVHFPERTEILQFHFVVLVQQKRDFSLYLTFIG